MFLFNKPKPSLADLIPQDYVDIHSHLLPGIDDGAKDANDTLVLVNGLKEYGFSEFITTPHVLTGVWNNTRQSISSAHVSAAAFLKQNGHTMPFKASAEYLLDDTFLKLLKTEPLLTLKDNHVLVEMSYISPPMQLYDILFQLQLEGYMPVLAHPERYLFYHHKHDEYEKLKRVGCSFQLNLLSVTGYYGKGVLDVAKKLLDNNMIDFTGSDAHHERHVASFKNKVLLKNTAPLITALNKNSFFKE